MVANGVNVQRLVRIWNVFKKSRLCLGGRGS